jgi:hypothetical protein
MYVKRVRVLAFVGPDVNGRTSTLSLRFKGDDGNWHEIWNYVTTGFYTSNLVNELIDLSAHPQMTQNRWYDFEVRGSTTDETYWTHFYPWVVAIEPETPALLPSPAFTNNTVSSAANFNTVRENILSLYNYAPRYHIFSRSKEITNPSTFSWVPVTELAMQRRRNPDIIVGMEIRSQAAHQWRVKAIDAAWNETTLYTSPIIPSGESPQYTIRAETVQLPGVQNEFFRLRFENYVHSNDWNVHGRRCFAFYESDLSVAPDWPVLNDWEHGETDVGNARLSAFNSAIASLLSGGEAINPRVPLTGGDHWVSGDSVDFVGPHRYRWLMYRIDGTDARPAVHYGPNFLYSHDLPKDVVNQMVAYDMANIKRLRPGMAVSVSDVKFAAESDRILL